MAAPWLDISYSRALVVGLAVVLGVTILVGGVTSGTVFGAYNPAWDGATDVRDVADSKDAETRIVQNTTTYASLDANQTVSFLFSPDTGYTGPETENVRQFVRDGGTLVVADDFGTVSNDLLARIGASTRVNGTLLRDERRNNDSPEFPIAPNVVNHTYTTGVDQLTLNRGTSLAPGNATVLVRSSNYSYLDTNGNGELDDTELLQRRPVVTIESLGTGEILVISDPSIFINVMLDRADNHAFAANLVSAHETVAFDVSHTASLPPLIAARLALQRTPVVQLLLGFGLVSLVAYWGRLAHVTGAIRDRFGPAELPETQSDPAVIERWVEQRHPDWDEGRVRRVTKEIINGQRERERND